VIDQPAAVLAGLLSDVRNDPRVLASAVSAAQGIGRPAKALPAREVLRHVDSMLDALIATLRGAPSGIIQAAEHADELAMDRARQGVGLEPLLDGVQAARGVVLDAVITAARSIMSADEVLPLLVGLDEAATGLLSRMVIAYQRTEQELARTRRHAQIEALRELLDGGSLNWAQEAALDLTAAYHCVVVDVSTPAQAQKVEALLDAGAGVGGIVRGYLCRVTTRLPSSDRLNSVLAVASPLVAVDRLAQVHALCREALVVYRGQGRIGLQPLIGAAFEVATAARPALGRMLCDELLARLDPNEDFHRLLATTALTYICEGNRTEPTAAVLHVHPNTVKYRIRRFAELTGQGEEPEAFGRSLAQSVNWWWALTAWLDDVAEPGREKLTEKR
jgi:hypothetical protein